MTNLFWPGDQRAGALFSDAAFAEAMVAVESTWLGALVDARVAPADARCDLSTLVADTDITSLADEAEASGNPVTGLVQMLRARAGDHAGRWLHRGLTSQDVLDTALMLCLRDALRRIRAEIDDQVATLAEMTDRYRNAPMLARTLTQPALPSRVGAKTASWLVGVLDAAAALTALPALSVQIGGGAGTLAACAELTGSSDRAVALAEAFASALGLAPAPPWHTTRATVTRTGDAMVTCCDAWGHIAADTATGSRREIGEFTERRGGGSSTMPHKSNPVLSVLIRRAAITAPALAAILHAASAASVDERSDGGWHAEWATLRTLSRRTVVAAAHTSELLAGLVIDTDKAAANLLAAGDLLGEQRSMTALTGRSALADYSDSAQAIIGAAVQRAHEYTGGEA